MIFTGCPLKLALNIKYWFLPLKHFMVLPPFTLKIYFMSINQHGPCVHKALSNLKSLISKLLLAKSLSHGLLHISGIISPPVSVTLILSLLLKNLLRPSCLPNTSTYKFSFVSCIIIITILICVLLHFSFCFVQCLWAIFWLK